ncbi:MAG: 30S ribosomal protein S17 [Candidatus Rokuibacteriota bacterium]
MPPKTQKAKKETVDRSRRRTVEGVVTADKMDKTIKVQVERLVQHPAFEKTLRKHYVCYAHDEKREAKRGDKVELMETRPISRLKHWRLLRVIEKAASPIQDAREAARPGIAGKEPAAAGKPSSSAPA